MVYELRRLHSVDSSHKTGAKYGTSSLLELRLLSINQRVECQIRFPSPAPLQISDLLTSSESC